MKYKNTKLNIQYVPTFINPNINHPNQPGLGVLTGDIQGVGKGVFGSLMGIT